MADDQRLPDIEEILRGEGDRGQKDQSVLVGLVEEADVLPPVSADEKAVRHRIRKSLVCRENKNGSATPLKTSAVNVAAVLRQDPAFANLLWKDLWTQSIMWGDKEYKDSESTAIRTKIWELYGFEPSKALVDEVAVHIAEKHGRNPLVDWLNSLEWDAQPRIDSYLVRGIGAEDNRLHRQMGRKWLISCVARALRPGCKVDTALILSGGQGLLKSTSFERLAGEEYFVDTALEIGDRRGYLQLQRAWIYELAELDSIRRRDTTQVKSFLTSHQDTFVPPYGRFPLAIPRHCVFCGTTNKIEFLMDPTGSRRFWPVKVGNIDLDWISENRAQIWAEAVEAFRKGECWWFDHAGEEALQEASETFREVDPWIEIIEAHMMRHAASGQSIHDILKMALGFDRPQMNRLVEIRVSDILQNLGYEKFRGSRNGQRAYLWRPAAKVVPINTATTNRKTGA